MAARIILGYVSGLWLVASMIGFVAEPANLVWPIVFSGSLLSAVLLVRDR